MELLRHGNIPSPSTNAPRGAASRNRSPPPPRGPLIPSGDSFLEISPSSQEHRCEDEGTRTASVVPMGFSIICTIFSQALRGARPSSCAISMPYYSIVNSQI